MFRNVVFACPNVLSGDRRVQARESVRIASECMRNDAATVMSPEEFTRRMHEIAAGGDTEISHAEADRLMMQVLTSLGYGDGATVFAEMDKWYA